MSKLIAAFQFNPSDTNRVKLQNYLKRHAMAVCLATPEEVQFLRANSFTL